MTIIKKKLKTYRIFKQYPDKLPLTKTGGYTMAQPEPIKKYCKKCRFFDVGLCCYVRANKTKDKYGNITKIDFDNPHNCQDYSPKEA